MEEIENPVKVSIILPTLNAADYIDEAVGSVLRQSLDDIELIVIDAGSTDGTWESLLEYQKRDNRVRLLSSKIKSVGHQSNMGLDAATGEYIGFLEDDYYAPNMCRELYDIAKANDLDWVKGDYTMFMDCRKSRYFLNVTVIRDKELKNRVFSPKDRPEILRWDANHWKGLYRREFIEKNRIRFNETRGAAFQDTGFVWQTYIYGERCMYVDASYYFYRRDNRVSSTFSHSGLLYFLDEFEYILRITSECPNQRYFLKAMFLRAFMMLFSQSEKLPEYSKQAASVEDAVIKICQYIHEAAQQGIISRQDVTAEQWINYQVAFKSPKTFLRYYPVRKLCEDEQYKEILRLIARYESVVLCGYGNEAKKWEMFIFCNGIVKNIFIADNNVSKQNTRSVNGVKIVSVSEAAKKCPKALFFIPSLHNSTKSEISEQLRRIGFSSDQTCCPSLWIHPYMATTVFHTDEAGF